MVEHEQYTPAPPTNGRIILDYAVRIASAVAVGLALYLFNQKGEDTLFRLHGTPEWKSIGTAASSGCIRLMNQDIIDLYNRVRPGKNARVVVKQ